MTRKNNKKPSPEPVMHANSFESDAKGIEAARRVDSILGTNEVAQSEPDPTVRLYGEMSGRLLLELSNFVRDRRPNGLVYLQFEKHGSAEFRWHENVENKDYRWTRIIPVEEFLALGYEHVASEACRMWLNQVYHNFFSHDGAINS